jgi:hypothetical protein
MAVANRPDQQPWAAISVLRRKICCRNAIHAPRGYAGLHNHYALFRGPFFSPAASLISRAPG